MDNAVFISIILTFFISEQPESFYDLLRGYNWKVLLIVFIEVFYDILQTVVKNWLINRVSFYFVLCLYGGYYWVFHYLDLWTNDEDDDSQTHIQLAVLFAIRFTAFILETIIDLCIDLELDYDLSNGPKIHSLSSWFCCLSKWNAKNTRIRVHHEWQYQGSVCVWIPIDVRDCDNDEYINTDSICCDAICCEKCRWFHYVLWLFAVPIALPVAIGIGLLGFVLSLFGKVYIAIHQCLANNCRPSNECCRKIWLTQTVGCEFARRDV